jgi:hypothetical protein
MLLALIRGVQASVALWRGPAGSGPDAGTGSATIGQEA